MFLQDTLIPKMCSTTLNLDMHFLHSTYICMKYLDSETQANPSNYFTLGLIPEIRVHLLHTKMAPFSNKSFLQIQ